MLLVSFPPDFLPNDGKTSSAGSSRWRRLVVILGLFLVTALQTGHAQGSFQNLGFEQSLPPSESRWWLDLMGWAPNTVSHYNTISLGGASIILHDSKSEYAQPLLGNYSLQLVNAWFPLPPSEIAVAEISQTGTIPMSAHSLRFLATSLTPVVLFAGSALTTQRIGGTARFHVLAADISSWAGQTGELRFGNTGMLDGISFSTVPVPEPHLIWLLLAGGMVLFVRRRHR